MRIARHLASFMHAVPRKPARRTASQARSPMKSRPPVRAAAKTPTTPPTTESLRKRLKYINTIAQNFRRARTPFEERFYYSSLVSEYTALLKNQLVMISPVKPSLFAQPRRRAGAALIKLMRKALTSTIANLDAYERDEIRDFSLTIKPGYPRLKIFLRYSSEDQEPVAIPPEKPAGKTPR